MLDPQIVVNLFAELGVGADLVRHSHWPDERFKYEIERLCGRVSELAGKCDAPPVRRQSDNGAHEWKAPGTAR